MDLTQKFLEFALVGAEWVLWLLVVLSVISVYVMLERFLFFRQIAGADGVLRRKLLTTLSERDSVANRYISGMNIEDGATVKMLKLKLIGSSASNITEIVRLSTPGRRMYATSDKIPIVKQGRGIVIISTSKGLMTGHQAKQVGLGGELICRIY